jgi:predicted ester cyclase
MLLQDVVV